MSQTCGVQHIMITLRSFCNVMFGYFKIHKWLKTVRSCSHEIEIDQAANDTINNETMVEQQEGNGKSQVQ